MEGLNVDQLTSTVLVNMNKDLGELMEGDCIFVQCEIRPPLDEELRVVLEDIHNESDKTHLIVMLETNGGFMETVERLVSVMRTHYEIVSFVIPNYAYSAGTILALSGDKIYMDYYSVLGPIDPHYRDDDGRLLSGVGYLTKFNELIEVINESGESSARAEMVYLVKNFDPSQLFQLEQSINHGISLVTKWLPKYKFKNWKKTESRETKVTSQMKNKRAENIAKVLGDAEKWHSHGRGISMEDLTGSDIKLKIDDFGKNEELNHAIRHYHGLCVDYYSIKSRITGYIHSINGVRGVI